MCFSHKSLRLALKRCQYVLTIAYVMIYLQLKVSFHLDLFLEMGAL